MTKSIDELLTLYEERHISRRELIGALLMTVTTQRDLTGTPSPKDALFQGRMINHVTLNVHDPDESRTFYQELLGASVLTDGRSSPRAAAAFDLRIGASFVSLAKNTSANVDHFAIGLNPWPGADRALDMVKKRFPNSEPTAMQNPVSKATEIRSVMLKDPDGLNVQLGSVSYQL